MSIRIPTKLNSEKFFRMFLILFWGKDILFSYGSAALSRIPYIKYVAAYVLPTLMLLCLLASLPYFVRMLSWKDICFGVAVVSIFLLNIILYPENEELLVLGASFFTVVLPMYFVGLRLNISKYWRPLYLLSIINVWLFSAYYLLLGGSAGSGDVSDFSSHMGRAYTLLPQLILVISGTIRSRKLLDLLTSCLGFVMLLMCGNRGSILIVVIYLIMYILLVSEKKRRMSVYAGVIAVCGIIHFFFEGLVTTLSLLFARLGMSTRVFTRLLEGSFFQSEGRNYIAGKLIEAIMAKPIIGYGLAGDRTIAGSYAHSYVLELWTSFGMILGSVMLIATAYTIVKAWLNTKDKIAKSFLLLLICVGFIKLFISSTFLQEGFFFLLLGVSVAQIRQSRRYVELTKRGKSDENL